MIDSIGLCGHSEGVQDYARSLISVGGTLSLSYNGLPLRARVNASFRDTLRICDRVYPLRRWLSLKVRELWHPIVRDAEL